MRVLVVGMGDLGADFATRAAAAGHEVFGLRRSQGASTDGVTRIVGDVTRPETLSLPDGLDAVAYAVAADERSDAAYERAYPVGLGNVLAAIDEAHAPTTRVLFVSSTGVYGQSDGSWVDESSPTDPPTFTGQRMVEAETFLAESPVRGTTLRLGGIYGPGRTFLIDSVRGGRATYPTDAPAWTNRIHRDDAARAMLHVLQIDEPPPALCVVDREPTERRVVLEWLAERLDAPPPQPATGGAQRMGVGDKRVRSDALVASGFVHTYPSFREGYAAVLAH